MSDVTVPESFDIMDLSSGKNAKVVFWGVNGYQSDRDNAMTKLTVGAEYLVEAMDVGQSSSTVTLQGVAGSFNSVMFANAPGPFPKHNWFADNYMTLAQIRKIVAEVKADNA